MKIKKNDFFCYLDPAQARQNVGPDLEQNCMTLCWYYAERWFLRKCYFEENQAETNDRKNLIFVTKVSLNIHILFH